MRAGVKRAQRDSPNLPVAEGADFMSLFSLSAKSETSAFVRHGRAKRAAAIWHKKSLAFRRGSMREEMAIGLREF